MYCCVVFRDVKIFSRYSPIHVALKFSFDFENIIYITFISTTILQYFYNKS